MPYQYPILRRLARTARDLKNSTELKDIRRNVLTEATGSLFSETAKSGVRKVLDKIDKKRGR